MIGRESEDTRQHRRLISSLSEAELDVLLCACRGMSVRQICEARGTLKATVRTQRKHALKKLCVGTFVEAAVIAAKAGVV